MFPRSFSSMRCFQQPRFFGGRCLGRKTGHRVDVFLGLLGQRRCLRVDLAHGLHRGPGQLLGRKRLERREREADGRAIGERGPRLLGSGPIGSGFFGRGLRGLFALGELLGA